MILRKIFNGKTKVLGELVNGIWKKTAHKQEHAFRSTPSWAVDAEILNNVKNELKFIQIHEISEGKVFVCRPEIIFRHGFEREFGGFGKQRFLPLKFWDVFDARTGELIYKYEPPRPKEELQPSLF